MKKATFIGLLALLPSLLQSCGGGGLPHVAGTEIIHSHSRLLRIDSVSPSLEIVTVRNPWDTVRPLGVYALVPRDSALPPSEILPEGAVTVRTPLRRSMVYSALHISLIDELGALDAVSGVCDGAYVHKGRPAQLVADGLIKDCGTVMQPSVEHVLALQPDAVLLSPYEGQTETALYANTGLAVVQLADYMEPTPLARAEWMRFVGRLYGKGHTADSLYYEVERQYTSLRDSIASKPGKRPKVLLDRIYNGLWDVPTSGSVTGIMIADAGGENPFASLGNGGSAHLAAEEVVVKGADADIWLIRYDGEKPTLASIGAENPLYKSLRPWRTGRVYAAHTTRTDLFEDGAFHPDRVLREMARILRGDTLLRYYEPVR